MSTMLLEIVTPEHIVYEKQVSMVSAKGVEGGLGILPNHIPLITPLQIAPVKVTRDGKDEYIAVQGGFMEVRKDKVIILAESAELPEHIDLGRATAAKERAEQRLREKKEENFDHLRAEIALHKAINRIGVSSHKE